MALRWLPVGGKSLCEVKKKRKRPPGPCTIDKASAADTTKPRRRGHIRETNKVCTCPSGASKFVDKHVSHKMRFDKSDMFSTLCSLMFRDGSTGVPFLTLQDGHKGGHSPSLDTQERRRERAETCWRHSTDEMEKPTQHAHLVWPEANICNFDPPATTLTPTRLRTVQEPCTSTRPI